MKIGAQRLVNALEAALRRERGTLPDVPISRAVAEDLLVIMRVAAKRDEGLVYTQMDGLMVLAWLRNEAAAYKAMAGVKEKGQERATMAAFAETCRCLANDLQAALERGKGTPIDPNMPRRWCIIDSGRSPGAGRPVGAPMYGVYYPRTDLCVNDMGGRGTGRPAGVEWIDPEP